jgi:prepilin-type N-terminal cleavage/methylation domain-containing protein
MLDLTGKAQPDRATSMPRRPRRSIAGFTLIELMLVLALMTFLLILSSQIALRAARWGRTAEARELLGVILAAEMDHLHEHGQFLACPPEPELPPGKLARRWVPGECWSKLAVRAPFEVVFQYSVEVGEDANGPYAVAVAAGDQDEDGRRKIFQLDSRDPRKMRTVLP